MLKVCECIACAHQRGVLHRDLKPANIMLAGFGQVYVTDWRLAQLLRTPERRAPLQPDARRGTAGTLDYMAPEQALCKPDLDERADVFGIGACSTSCSAANAPTVSRSR